jgi:hypothetical protein
MQLFRTAYPTVDPDVVEAVVRSLEGDMDAIICKLQEMAYVPADTEMLRMQVASMARNKHMPALRKQNARGDGKCMFHAMAQCLSSGGRKTTGEELLKFTLHMMQTLKGPLREQIIECLRLEQILLENIASQKKDQELLDERINALKGDAWGGEIELRVLAETLGLKIHIWTPFNEYARTLGGKEPKNVHQVSQNVEYILTSDYTCFGHGKREVHLLYTYMCHYDSLLKD